MTATSQRTTGQPVRRLTVVYDDRCNLCLRCQAWLATQPLHVEVATVASSSPAARRRYGHLPWIGEELVVIADDGRTWIGPAAFVTCLWATKRWRPWSHRLSGRTLAPVAERFFHLVSARRGAIGGMLRSPECEWCDRPGART